MSETFPVSYRVPEVSTESVAGFLNERFGLTGTLTPLPGERDRNFRLDTAGGLRFVAKVANLEEAREVLELQHAALHRIFERVPQLTMARVVPARDGQTIVPFEAGAATYLVRVLTWVPGVPLATAKPKTRTALRSLGETIGTIHKALDGFDHPAAHRELKWDLARAGWIENHWDAINDPDRWALAERMFRPYTQIVRPRWNELPKGVIYGDANDYNVLVDENPAPPRRTVSVIDFGDMVHSAMVADLAIALAYAMLDLSDPMAAAAEVVTGYTSVWPLSDAELECLWPLTIARLVVSVVNSAIQRRDTPPGNEYLFVSEAPVWRLLDQLAAVHPRLATYRIRAAAGSSPCPEGDRITRWVEKHRDEFIPLIGIAEGILPPRVDLSIGSEFLDDFRLITDEPRLNAKITAAREAVGARIAIGEYDEPRLLYTSELFRTPGWDGSEWRTVHIGLDLFTGAGCPVRIPLAGRVKSVRNNAGPGDYGPTVIVEHRVKDEDGPFSFFTLYGHLDLETVNAVFPGQPLPGGATIGRLGSPTVNGGWAPHLHFQIVADLLDREGEFPGVARPSERAVWTSLCPDPHTLAGIPSTKRRDELSATAILERRKRLLGGNLSVAYREPLHIVRGWMQHLYAADGRRYLDCVNNVPHVGHGHPRVVAAGQRQMAVLNTNTRYLHETIIRYAERLTQLLPDPLRVCFFVNSGSEANELALRLALAHTRRSGIVVVDAAYHGNTRSLVGLSPYKCEGPGGAGLPPNVRKVPLPDRYRGLYRGDDPSLGERYAAHVDEAVAELERGGTPAGAFLAESVLSCGGQVVLPPGYLDAVYRRIRAAGGVAIADEVQVGFGRVGSHFWGFETQQVTPDIVVMGKPAGNGHPLGVVVTTPAIAESFANGMEFFSTFGGNPVSCAIGLAVLDVMFDEDLQARAWATGQHLLAGLADLTTRHEAAGDARGLGLFVGLELVTDKESREPNARAAAYLANRLREMGLLVSTDGPDHNVIKIKPPMCFGREDADRLVDALDQALGEDGAR